MFISNMCLKRFESESLISERHERTQTSITIATSVTEVPASQG